MDIQKIKPRVRLIIIQDNKILLSFVKSEDFYFFIGGKMEYGETLQEAWEREALEETEGNFTFRKFLYITDYIKPEINEHSIEIYMQGSLDKGSEIDGIVDPEFAGDHWQTWVDLDKLKDMDVRPKKLVDILLADYQKGFTDDTNYLGKLD